MQENTSFPPSSVGMQTVLAGILTFRLACQVCMHSHAGAWERERENLYFASLYTGYNVWGDGVALVH
jgi:hypothetical protein